MELLKQRILRYTLDVAQRSIDEKDFFIMRLIRCSFMPAASNYRASSAPAQRRKF